MKQILLVEDVESQAKALKSIIQSHIPNVQIAIASKGLSSILCKFLFFISW